MSIVIPASQLKHTIITVRCENAPTAPQIECAFDDQAPPGLISHEDKGSSFTFSDRRAPTFHRRVLNNSVPPVEASSLGSPRADLSIERGVDQRGHFVRMSFSPAPCLGNVSQRSNPPPKQGPPGTNYYPSAECQAIPRQATPRIASPRQPTPHQQNTSLNQSNPPELMPPAQITSNSQPSQTIDQTALDFSSMDFSLPMDDELMNALQSSLNGFDYSQNLDFLMSQMSEGAIPDFGTSQQFDNSSIPATPELISSSSSSSTFSSPPTPFDFGLPSTSPSFSASSGTSYSSGNPVPQAETASPHFPIDSMQPTEPKLQPQFQVQSHGFPSQLESRLLPCPHPGCKRQFKNTSTLTGHLKTHAGKGTRFPCSFPPCTEKFSRRHDQLRHEVYKHGKRCEWVCNKCNSFFSYERSLEKHTCTLDKSRRGSLPVQTVQQPAPPSEGDGGGSGGDVQMVSSTPATK